MANLREKRRRRREKDRKRERERSDSNFHFRKVTITISLSLCFQACFIRSLDFFSHFLSLSLSISISFSRVCIKSTSSTISFSFCYLQLSLDSFIHLMICNSLPLFPIYFCETSGENESERERVEESFKGMQIKNKYLHRLKDEEAWTGILQRVVGKKESCNFFLILSQPPRFMTLPSPSFLNYSLSLSLLTIFTLSVTSHSFSCNKLFQDP